MKLSMARLLPPSVLLRCLESVFAGNGVGSLAGADKSSDSSDKPSVACVEKSECAGLEEQGPSSGGVGAQELKREKCPICLDLMSPGSDVASCTNRHDFHAGCLERWKDIGRKTCPTCRKVFIEEVHETERIDHLYNDPDLEDKYMCQGRPIDPGPVESRFFMTMCERLSECINSLTHHHPIYFFIFRNPGCHRFYIPHDVAIVSSAMGAGPYDPRTKGFAKRKATMIKQMLAYVELQNSYSCLQSEERPPLLDYYIVQPIYSVVNMFCALDSLMEYSHTELYEIKDLAEKRSAVMNDPGTYPALHSSMSCHPGCSLDQIYEKLEMVAFGRLDPAPTFYSDRWLLTISELG